jgi:RHS repeat-associated protein
MAEQRSYTGSFTNRWKFTGKELDEETGLYYFGARFYNPVTSLWLSVDPLVEKTKDAYGYCYQNPIRFIDPDGKSPMGQGDGFGPGGCAPGEIIRKSGDDNKYTKGTRFDKGGVQVLEPDGKYYSTGHGIGKVTYSDGKVHDGQQKKEGVWTYTNKDGNFMWDNVKQKYVLNTSDRAGGQNSFPSVGKAGTTYAGSDNPKNAITGDDDYSQPPQTIADFGGFIHDRAYDKERIVGADGVMSPKSTPSNNVLINFCKLICHMYNKKGIDPYTGAPISEKTRDAALFMLRGFSLIEVAKKKE